MTQSRYSSMALHKAEHRQFLQEFTSLKSKFDKEGASAPLVILIQQRVCNWLISHVGKSDKALGSFLQAKA